MNTGLTPDVRTLVLLHAFPLSSEMWRPQIEAAPAGWRVVAPDLRGFGRSPAGDPLVPASMQGYARDVLALLDRLGAGRAVVVGLSMGGYVAFALLSLARERVAGLVLADTRPEADDEVARANRDRMKDVLASDGPAAVLGRLLPNLLGATTRNSRPDVVRQVTDLALSQPADAIALAIHALKTRPDSTPLLATVDCPALILVGDEDSITGPDVARRMHAALPGSELAVIEQAGHLSNLERPDAFNAALARFLAARF